jgi:uncharacterized membrane protein YhaH (DUF805 family)
MKFYFEAFRKYAVFSGRAQRSEFWWYSIINGVVMTFLTFVAGTPGAIFGNAAAPPAL